MEYIITTVVYLLLTIFSFKSFLDKDTYRASNVTIMTFLGFLMYLLDSLLALYLIYIKVDYRLNHLAVNLDIVGTLFLFYTAAKMRSLYTEINYQTSLIRIKILNLLFFLMSIIILFSFNFIYLYSINKYMAEPFYFSNITLNLLYFGIMSFLILMIMIHIPFIEKYKILKIIIFGFFIKYLIMIIYEIIKFKGLLLIINTISIVFSVLFTIIGILIYKDTFGGEL